VNTAPFDVRGQQSSRARGNRGGPRGASGTSPLPTVKIEAIIEKRLENKNDAPLRLTIRRAPRQPGDFC